MLLNDNLSLIRDNFNFFTITFNFWIFSPYLILLLLEVHVGTCTYVKKPKIKLTVRH